MTNSDAWRDVEAGRRELDWAVALGDPTEAGYLTPVGRQVMARAIEDLDGFFGPGWLQRATHPSRGAARPPMHTYFASMLGPPAMVAAIGLWARLQLLVLTETPGVDELRRNLRANPSAEEFRHHIALARLAVIALHAGAQVTLEPPKPQGGPGDLRAVRAGSDMFVEIRTFGPDRAFRSYNRRVDQATTHLRVLEHRHDVHWDGELPADLTSDWVDTVAAAAAEAAASGTPVQVVVDTATLTALPGPAAVGTQTVGPLWETTRGHGCYRH